MVEQAKNDPEVQRTLADVRRLDHLREDPGWQILFLRIKEQKDAYMLRIARYLMNGGKVDQDQITFMRGYYAGARDTVEQPETAVESLERAARAAYQRALRDLISEDEEPYT